MPFCNRFNLLGDISYPHCSSCKNEEPHPWYFFSIIYTETMTTSCPYSSAFPDTNIYMLENEVLCDFTFRVGVNKTEMKGHKFVLASRNLHFFTMFSEPHAKTVDAMDVPDTDPNIWTSFLR